MNKRKTVTTSILMLMVLALAGMTASAMPPPVQLTGRTTFVGFFSTSGFVFAPDWYNYCSAEATLTQTGEQAYSLEVNEWDCGRVCTWELKITDGGEVKGEGYASCDPPCATGSCLGEVKLHTGCEADHGTFPIYHGTWDGHILSIASHFHGRCDGGTYWGESWFWDGWGDIPAVPDPEGILDDGVTWDDGPAHVTFGLELTVTD